MSGIQSHISGRDYRIQPARKHIIAYLNAWFFAKLKRNKHGKHGIGHHEVQDLANVIIDRMEAGEETVSIDFIATRSNINIPVTISSSGVLWLQKMDPDPSSSNAQKLCKQLVVDTLKSTASAQTSTRLPPQGYQTFVNDNGHCFSLPFPSTDPSQLLSCGLYSTEMVNYRSGSNGNYFWNSLRDTIGTNPIIINGIYGCGDPLLFRGEITRMHES